MKLHFSTSDGQWFLFFVVCALINHVFAVAESGQLATELPSAKKTIPNQPLGYIENRDNTGQRLKKHDSKRNMTVDFFAPKSNKMVTSRRQYEESRQSATTPAQLQAMYASRWKRIRRDDSSDQSRIARRVTTSPEKFAKTALANIRKGWLDDTTNVSRISSKTYYECFSKFPKEFQDILQKTDTSEAELLLAYFERADDKNFTDKRMETYKQSIQNEREMLRTVITNNASGAEEIIANYKALRKGVAWDHIQRNTFYKDFFKEPSALRTEYEAVKKDEIESIDSYLGPTLQQIKELLSQQTEAPISAAQLEQTTSTNSTLGGSGISMQTVGIIGGAVFVIAGIGIAIFFITRHFRNKTNKNRHNPRNEQTPLRSMLRSPFFGSSTAKTGKTSKSTRVSKALK